MDLFSNKKMGRKPKLSETQRKEIKQLLNDGAKPARLAEKYDVSIPTITRIRDEKDGE